MAYYKFRGDGDLGYGDDFDDLALGQSHFTPAQGFIPAYGMDAIDPSFVNLSGHDQLNYYSANGYQSAEYYQPSEQRPLQRFMNESDQMGPVRSAHLHQNRSMSNSSAMSTVPRAAPRKDSPTPSLYSRGFTTSSSANSPAGEGEQIYDPALFSPNVGTFAHPTSLNQGPAPGGSFLHDMNINQATQYGSPGATSGYGHVNLSQVQTFADTQDMINFGGADEGYDMHQQNIVFADQHQKDDQDNYHYATDEGLGSSVQVSAAATPYLENEDDPSEAPSPETDGDYQPRKSAAKSKKRTHGTHAASQPPAKRGRNANGTASVKPSVKSTSKTSQGATLSHRYGTFTCTSCEAPATFASQLLLDNHVLKIHNKAYKCVFSFADCKSSFPSKNEWKRHVESQHTPFVLWVCREGTCGNSGGSQAQTSHGKSAEAEVKQFNRKDLYTSHLRRMHQPTNVTKSCEKSHPATKDWEETIKSLHLTASVDNLLKPTKLGCPVDGCESQFTGEKCWDERMEHLGKHLANIGRGLTAFGKAFTEGDEEDDIDMTADPLFMSWALEAGVIAHDPLTSGFCFLDQYKARLAMAGGGEEDAEGEEEE